MTIPADTRAKRNVAILIAAQAFLGSQMPMVFVVGGLAGQQLTPLVCLATLPISLIVFGSMLTAPRLSTVMQRYGRKTGFYIGALGGMLGGLIGAYALMIGSFWLFLAASFCTGIYMSAQGFYRFAATDTASDSYRPKAISYVMAGGLISAIIGPQLATFLADNSGIANHERYIPVYIAVACLNVVGLLIFTMLDLPKVDEDTTASQHVRSRLELLQSPKILVAVICATVSYALMNLVMTSTPLAVVACGFSEVSAGPVVTGHVLAMFAPSFFTGHLINRFGVERIMGLGLLILAAAGVVALQGVALGNFFVALILLGIGWNFGFIGATTLLTSAHTPAERGRMQGMNDLIVFGGVTVASLASGGLMNCAGGDAVAGWNAVNLAMAPFLVLAGGALLWLMMRPRVVEA
ncbi:MAG: MFS transporter [Pseudomonadota bacterium]